MKTLAVVKRRFIESSVLLGSALLLVAIPLVASAELGGNVASVQADQVHMKASLKTTSTDGYTVHEIQARSGTAVREYVSADGKVFAVAWRGPFLPDFHQILGASFTPFVVAARTQKGRRSGHRPVFVQQAGLIAISAGHPRDYFGKAYLPALLPQGVSAEEIR